MIKPRDELERDLYSNETVGHRQLDPVWQVLVVAVAAYVVAGSLAVYSQTLEPTAAGFESAVLIGGVLVTVGSGLVAGVVLLLAVGLLDRISVGWACG